MSLHFANLWEALADRQSEKIALCHGRREISYREYEDRAARLAALLAANGIERGAKVGIYCMNRPEYLEAQFAAFKIGATPFNVNYRYVDDELLYLFDNADAEAVFFEARFGSRIAAIRAKLPKLTLLIEIADESGNHIDDALRYEDTIAAHTPRKREPQSPDDIYMLYTGGTTGMPKGVMYRHEDFCFGMMSCYDIRELPRPTNIAECLANIDILTHRRETPVMVIGCPLMHGTGMWIGAMMTFALGGTVVTLPEAHFDPHALWKTVVDRHATDVTIVGDAFAKPMLSALDEADAAGKPYDIASLKRMISSGVMWTREVKQALLARHDMLLIDAIGSTEGSIGLSVASRAMPSTTARFMIGPTTKVFAEDGREIAPGSTEIGLVAAGGVVPLGYYKDPVKSAATFREVNGVRYSFPGDHAKVESDGTITLLGRGSQCINTAGEKVFPEEVEEAVKRHPAVYDCLVVGVPDDRFGEKVVAVLSFRPGERANSGEIEEQVRHSVAGYKVPRAFVVVDKVMRAVNGKADYKWARELARLHDV